MWLEAVRPVRNAEIEVFHLVTLLIFFVIMSSCVWSLVIVVLVFISTVWFVAFRPIKKQRPRWFTWSCFYCLGDSPCYVFISTVWFEAFRLLTKPRPRWFTRSQSQDQGASPGHVFISSMWFEAFCRGTTPRPVFFTISSLNPCNVCKLVFKRSK